MRKNSESKSKLLGGILNSPSGSLVGFIVTKRGVIYIKEKKTKKKRFSSNIFYIFAE